MCSNNTGCSDIWPKLILHRLSNKTSVNDHVDQRGAVKSTDFCHVSSTCKENKKKNKTNCNASVKYKRKLRNRTNEASASIESCNVSIRNTVNYKFRNRVQSLSHSSVNLLSRGKLKTLKQITAKNIKKYVTKKARKTKKNTTMTRSNKIQLDKTEEVQSPVNKSLGDERKKDLIICETKPSVKKLYFSSKTKINNSAVKTEVTSKNIDNVLENKNYNNTNKLKKDVIDMKYQNEFKNNVKWKEEIKTTDSKETKLNEIVLIGQHSFKNITECELSNYSKDDKNLIELVKEDDSDSEIGIIKEIENVWVKIEHTAPVKRKNNRNERLELGRSKQIDLLINENKMLTIPIPVVKKVTNTSTEGEVEMTLQIKSNEMCSPLKTDISKRKDPQDNEVKAIKMKSFQDVGIIGNERIGDQNDCRLRLMKYGILRKERESKIEEICFLFPQYFNTHVKSLLKALIKMLYLILGELYNGDCLKLSNIYKQPDHIENIKLDNEQCISILKKYSKDFVATFKDIINTFKDIHKAKMIPIIYLQILRVIERLTLIKSEKIRSIILKIFHIEAFTDKYDIICYKTCEQSEKILSIFERWLWKFLVEENIYESLSSSLKSKNIYEKEYYSKNINILGKKVTEEGEVNMKEFSPLVIDFFDKRDLDSNTENKQNGEFLKIGNNVKLCVNILTEGCESVRTNSVCELVESRQKSNSTFQACNIGASSDPKCGIEMNLDKMSDRGKQRIQFFNYQESVCPLNCLNASCQEKQLVPCFYCKEPVSCVNLCKVEDDQIIFKMQQYIVSCKAHKSIVWQENYVQDWGEVDDHKMPYEPQCWRNACAKKPLIICLCKTRAYCSVACREEDWRSSHHESCSWQTDSTLLYIDVKMDS